MVNSSSALSFASKIALHQFPLITYPRFSVSKVSWLLSRFCAKYSPSTECLIQFQRGVQSLIQLEGELPYATVLQRN